MAETRAAGESEENQTDLRVSKNKTRVWVVFNWGTKMNPGTPGARASPPGRPTKEKANELFCKRPGLGYR